jgi:transcriptional/translational regulatory protein YebC/TACO1
MTTMGILIGRAFQYYSAGKNSASMRMRIAYDHRQLQSTPSYLHDIIRPQRQQRWSSNVRRSQIVTPRNINALPLRQLIQQRPGQGKWHQPHHLNGGVLGVAGTLPSFALQYHQQQYHHQQQRRTMMAGHNKWSKIRHKKGAKDVNRALILSKASRKVIAASRACAGDVSNLRLQSAIALAKAVRLPKDRLQEAIAKGSSSSNNNSGTSQDLEQLRFDAMMNFAGHKVGCIITALTDNRNRTVQHVRAIVTKQGGEFLATDQLAYLFVQVGVILVEHVEEEDDLLLCALDAGAMNVEPEQDDEDDDSAESDDDDSDGDDLKAKSSSDSDPRSTNKFIVTTEEKDLWQVVTSLKDGGFQVSQFEHRYVLVDEDHGAVSLSEEGTERLELFLEKLEENEDVTNVYHSASP